jgi:DNA repair exonuclease SbcCD ATPase subunit
MLAAVLTVAGCGKDDNSTDTDRASEQLREAQGEVRQTAQEVAANQDAIEQQQRALVQEQQALADRQKLLDQQRAHLGSAQQALQQARAAYGAAVNERLAKLDAALATLATKTDAKSRDAAIGLQARRAELGVKLRAMQDTSDPGWADYTKDVDATFDAIERDLHDATR